MGLRILILGGTGLTGPHQLRYALARGHRVTVFNRGRTRPGELPPGVEHLTGDRNLGQLDALRGRHWDVCIDNPTTLPAWVRDAAGVLRGSVDRYVFISTISVYADMSRRNDESSPLAPYEGADAFAESIDAVRASGFRLYGPLKALSEQQAQEQFPGRSLVIRPGLIVGPGDETDRFSYWPVRLARGGEVLAPGEPSDPAQLIDGRDLAEWTIRMAEQGTTGVFNATGPAQPLGMGAMLERVRAGVQGDDARLTWVAAEFLREHDVAPWTDMPVWLPPIGDHAAMSRTPIDRALAAGLTFRPLELTARETLDWFRSRPAERQSALKAGLSPERERQVLAAWHARVR